MEIKIRSYDELIDMLIDKINSKSKEDAAQLFSDILDTNIKYVGDDNGFYEYHESELSSRRDALLFLKLTQGGEVMVLRTINTTGRNLDIGEVFNKNDDTQIFLKLMSTIKIELIIDEKLKNKTKPDKIEVITQEEFESILLGCNIKYVDKWGY